MAKEQPKCIDCQYFVLKNPRPPSSLYAEGECHLYPPFGDVGVNPNWWCGQWVETDDHYSRGLTYLENHRYAHAIHQFDQAIQLDPDNAGTWLARGCSHYHCQDKNYDQAVADCTQSIRLDSDNSEAYFHRALVWVEMSKYENALNDFNQAIHLNPDIAEYHYQKGNAMRQSQDMVGARLAFQRAKELGHPHANSYI